MKVQKHKNLAQFRKHQKPEERQNSSKPENSKKNPISLETQKPEITRKSKNQKSLKDQSYAELEIKQELA